MIFGGGLFRPFGPLVLALAAYRAWRRLPEQRKQAIKRRAHAFAAKVFAPEGHVS